MSKSKAFMTLLVSTGILLPVMAYVQEGHKLSLQDYQDIEQLTAGYPYKIDKCTNSGYDYADQYTSDAIFGVSSAWGSAGKVWYRGREELANAGGGGKDGCRVRKMRPGATPIHHIVTSQVITATATGASGKSTLLSVGAGGNPTAIEWQGGYEDTYVKTASGWRFKSRFHVWPDHPWPDTAAQQAALMAAPQAAPQK